MNDKQILIFQFSAYRDGSAISALLLADGFRAAGWSTHIAFGYSGPIISHFQENGHQCYILQHKNWLRTKSLFSFFKSTMLELSRVNRFVELIRSIQPQIIYVNTLVSLSAVVAGRFCRLPVIWHLRELFDDAGGEMYAPAGARSLISLMIRGLSTQIITNSRVVVDNIINYSDLNIEVVPNAVEERFFVNYLADEKSWIRRELPANKLVVGIPGTLRPAKGHIFCLRAIAPLLTSNNAFHLAISGGGESSFLAKLEYEIASLGITEQVTFLGSLADMPAFYRACDLIVVPSRSETFGRVIIEAFASKVPVIATAVGGIPEIIRHGKNGWLVAYGAEEALRDAVVKLLDQSEVRESLVEEAYHDACRLYTAKVYQQRTVEIAEQLL